ncbi:hypothetical protein K2V56_10560 [Staphylococcus chromogenes]|uniref:hypothetical protein n=1 Tax=Staphylococcus chromogenes TaxID=46126 RepID=UPI001E3F9311|nr:hypothetical protein [Staphylococcus chromogenes]MCD8905924.1 hypothetical protein [Staphylococcus chromogenes]
MSKSKGVDDFINRLDKLVDNANEISGTHEYSFEEFLSTDFMKKNTDKDDFYDFVESSNFDISNQSDFDKVVETSDWNNYVRNHSVFDSWQDMFDTAVKEMISKKLFK